MNKDTIYIVVCKVFDAYAPNPEEMSVVDTFFTEESEAIEKVKELGNDAIVHNNESSTEVDWSENDDYFSLVNEDGSYRCEYSVKKLHPSK